MKSVATINSPNFSDDCLRRVRRRINCGAPRTDDPAPRRMARLRDVFKINDTRERCMSRTSDYSSYRSTCANWPRRSRTGIRLLEMTVPRRRYDVGASCPSVWFCEPFFCSLTSTGQERWEEATDSSNFGGIRSPPALWTTSPRFDQI
jgi:hypothetical protein